MLKKGTVEERNELRRRGEGLDSSTFIMEPKVRHYAVPVIILVCLILIGAAVVYVIRDNHRIKVTTVNVASEALPESFDGYRILLLSDIRGVSFGTDNQKLTDRIGSLEFDAAILIGDFLNKDSEEASLEPAIDVVEKLVSMEKPVYFVLGEYDSEKPENASEDWGLCIEPSEDNYVYKTLTEAGAQYAYPIVELKRGEDRIFLTGRIYYEKLFDSYKFDSDKDFSIMVTYRPVDYDVDKRLSSQNRYSFREVDFDMSLSGHTLAGQYRLPLLKTLYLKGYGLFPQESVSYGLHYAQGRANYITSGLGLDSGFRLFNTPEVAIIQLNYREPAPEASASPEAE